MLGQGRRLFKILPCYMYLSDIVFQMSYVLPLSLTLSMLHAQSRFWRRRPVSPLPPSISKPVLRSLLHSHDTPGSTLHVSKYTPSVGFLNNWPCSAKDPFAPYLDMVPLLLCHALSSRVLTVRPTSSSTCHPPVLRWTLLVYPVYPYWYASLH